MARTLDFEPEQIPQKLQDIDRWMCAGRDKAPRRVANPTEPASKMEPDCWTTFDQLITLIEQTGKYLPFFCIPKGYYWIDIDRVKDPPGPLPFDPETGELHPTAAQIVEALDGYAYRSVSGTGVHIVVRSKKEGLRITTGVRHGELKVEILGLGDGVVMTGDLLDDSSRSIANRTARLVTLHETLTGEATAAPEDDVTDWKQLGQGVAQGQRNSTLCQLLGHWSGIGLSVVEITDCALMFARRCKPAYPKKDTIGAVEHFTEKDSTKADGKRGPNAATRLVRIAQKKCALFRDQAGTGFAKVNVDGRINCYQIASEEFKEWLGHSMFEQQGMIPNRDAIKQAQAELTYQSRSTPVKSVFVRCGSKDSALYYDLCNPDGQVVEITPEGWEIIDHSPVRFRRYKHMLPQVAPLHGGSLEPLLDLFNLSGDTSRMLMGVYLVSLFLPEIDHLICNLLGPQGGGKTQAGNIIRRFVDPSGAGLLSPPSNLREAALMYQHHYVAMFDNVTRIKDWLLDLMCCAVTGSGHSKRQLYSDDGEVIYQFRRVTGFTAISNPLWLRPDALDRSLLLNMMPITDRRRKTRAEIEQAVTDALPCALGGAFDAIVHALEIYPTVKPKELPRMADFYTWSIAIAEGLGYETDVWERTYRRHVWVLDLASLESDSVAATIRELCRRCAANGFTYWKGPTTLLYKELSNLTDALHISQRSNEWPKSPNWLSHRIGRAQAGLLKLGINISRKPDAQNTFQITIMWPSADAEGPEDEAEVTSGRQASVRINMDDLLGTEGGEPK